MMLLKQPFGFPDHHFITNIDGSWGFGLRCVRDTHHPLNYDRLSIHPRATGGANPVLRAFATQRTLSLKGGVTALLALTHVFSGLHYRSTGSKADGVT